MIGVECSGCSETVDKYFMCDQDEPDQKYCELCWDTHPCPRFHEEGCETIVHVSANSKLD